MVYISPLTFLNLGWLISDTYAGITDCEAQPEIPQMNLPVKITQYDFEEPINVMPNSMQIPSKSIDIFLPIFSAITPPVNDPHRPPSRNAVAENDKV